MSKSIEDIVSNTKLEISKNEMVESETSEHLPSFKERLYATSNFTLGTIIKSAVAPFLLPTVYRLEKNREKEDEQRELEKLEGIVNKEQKHEISEFYKHLIIATAGVTLFPMVAHAALLAPVATYALLATNAGSLVGETLHAFNQKSLKDRLIGGKNYIVDKSKTFGGYISKKTKGAYEGIKNLFSSKKNTGMLTIIEDSDINNEHFANYDNNNNDNKLPKKGVKYWMKNSLAPGVLGYIASGAIGLMLIIPGMQKHDTHDINLDHINFEVHSCAYTVPNKDTGKREERKMLMVGELHLYNECSSEMSDILSESGLYDVLLSEGVGPEIPERQTRQTITQVDLPAQELQNTNTGSQQPQQKSEFKQPMSEKMFSKFYDLTEIATKSDFPTPTDHAIDNGTRVIYIEEYDEERGVREGVSTSANIAIGAMGAIIIGGAPVILNAYYPAAHLGIHNSPVIKYTLSSGANPLGLVELRNQIMADEILLYSLDNPESIPLVRLGQAHLSGVEDIIENNLSPKSDFRCEPLTFEEIELAYKNNLWL